MTSVTVFRTLFWDFYYWLWTGNCFLGYEMVRECNQKQKCVEVSLIELFIALIWSWFRDCLLFFNVKNGLCIGIWKDISRIPWISISWHLDTARRLGVRKTFSRHSVYFKFLQAKTYWSILKSIYNDKKVPLIPLLLVDNNYY